MIHSSEAHSLQVGQHFSFLPEGQDFEVDSVSVIDYWGEPLFLYKTPDGLHGHVSDHTVVYVIE